jgi:cytosine/creatinine deaminase
MVQRLGEDRIPLTGRFRGRIDWLRDRGFRIIDLDCSECAELVATLISAHPRVWNEDIREP